MKSPKRPKPPVVSKTPALRTIDQRLDDSLEQLKASAARRDALENVPPDVILRAREMDAEGKFKRRVIRRVPKTFVWDWLELECGHKDQTLASSRQEQFCNCQECIESWLLRPQKKAKTGAD